MSNHARRKNWKSVSQRNRIKPTKTDYNSLEQRLALTTFVVTSLGDGVAEDGLVTFREAIVAANTNAASGDAAAGDVNGDVIRFDSSLAGGTISLTDGQLTISDDLAIQGGDFNITVDAQNLSRAFEITSSETVSLGRINVTGGNAGIGGGLLATGSGDVVVFGGEYSGNVATGEGGGAIYSGASDLLISGGAIFDGNIANGASGSGGAIFNVGGIASANDAVFTANIANRAGGAIEITGGDLFLTDVTFGGSSSEDGNVAGPTGSAAPGNGGALHITAGGTVSITDSVFANNFAAREGGALWNQAGTTVYINSSEGGEGEDINIVVDFIDEFGNPLDGLIGLEGRSHFQDNTAAGDGSDDGGGAVFNNGGDLVVNGGSFRNNSTNGSGGAIFSTDGLVLIQDDSGFSNNRSASAGGAVEIIDGDLFDTGSFYTENRARSQVSNSGNGGAFHVNGTATAAFNGTQFFGNVADSEGGAVWNAAGSTLFITDVEFNSNFADGNDADNGGGAIFNNGGDVFVSSSMFTENYAVGTAAGTAGSGGAIFSTNGQVLIQNDSEFSRNSSARAGGAVEIIDGNFFDTGSRYFGNSAGVDFSASPGNGGAIHITGTATSAFNGTQFSFNGARSEGGAVWNAAGSTMFLTNVTIISNVASGNDADNGGGGIFNNGGAVFVNDSTVSMNQASGAAGSGGGALSVAGVLRFDNSTISFNQATRAGGGVEVIDGRAIFRSVSLASNRTGLTLTAALSNGGGLHVSGNETVVTFSNSTITSNSAVNEGGGLWNQIGSTLILDNATNLSFNSAGGVGGGIYNQGYLSALDTVFEGNTSDDDGGAVYITPSGSARIEDSTLTFNVAADDGGAVFNLGNFVTLGSTYGNNSGDTIFTVPAAFTTISDDTIFANFQPAL